MLFVLLPFGFNARRNTASNGFFALGNEGQQESIAARPVKCAGLFFYETVRRVFFLHHFHHLLGELAALEGHKF